MIHRRALPGTIVALLLALPFTAEAQAPPKIPRIGFLSPLTRTTEDARLIAFLQGLGELGYVDGRTIAIEYRFAENRPERLPALAAELVASKVEVIVTAGPAATEAAKQATSTIPIVFGVSGDPVASGLVAGLARPGGNITGPTSIAPEVVGKQLELLKEVVPRISRVALLTNPSNPGHPIVVRQAEGAAKALGLQLHVVPARVPSELDAAFARMRGLRVDGALVVRDAMVFAQRNEIAALAARSRLPAVYGFRENAEAGGLMAYGANVPLLYHRAATYVDKILKGAKPATLPVEQPTRFELVINLKTAKALGLTIPPALLARADEVIE